MNHSIKNPNRLYGSIKVYAIDGKHLMFLCNKKKANWYLDRDLAESYKDGIRLLFEAKGLGHSSKNDEYYLSPKENRCVVTGCEEVNFLTRHHIVPHMYRKWFPIEVKSRSSHDIVLLNIKTHDEYENEHAIYLKNKIADEFGVPRLSSMSMNIGENYKTNLKAQSLAYALLNNKDTIPVDRYVYLQMKFESFSGLESNEENYNKILDINFETGRLESEHGKLIVEKITDLQEFVERWRKHFIDCMSPDYMPKGWKINRNIYD
jgi:hypothetical protein